MVKSTYLCCIVSQNAWMSADSLYKDMVPLRMVPAGEIKSSYIWCFFSHSHLQLSQHQTPGLTLSAPTHWAAAPAAPGNTGRGISLIILFQLRSLDSIPVPSNIGFPDRNQNIQGSWWGPSGIKLLRESWQESGIFLLCDQRGDSPVLRKPL